MDWIYPLSGFVVGGIVGMTGVGGGSLMTPLLVLVFGVSPATAVGTDLLYAAITKAGGVVAHGRKGSIDWRTVRLLATGSIPAALVTTWAMRQFLHDAQLAEAIIKGTLGVALLLTAVAIVFRSRVVAWSRDLAWPRPEHVAPATVATGAVLGTLVTAGAVGVAVLFFLYPGLSAVKIVGSDIAHAVPLTLVAGLGHAALGTVDYWLLASLVAGSLPGIWLGSHVAQWLPEHWLRPALASMLVVIGGKLVL